MNGDERITCPLCGFQFHERDARATVCQRCPLKGGCGVLIKCPNCNYEIPKIAAPPPLTALLSKLGRLISRR